MIVGCSTFGTTYGGIQQEILNHISNSRHDFILYSDFQGPMDAVFRGLPNVKEIVYCRDDEITKQAKKSKCDVFIHHAINHTTRESILTLKPEGIPVVVFHHCVWSPVYDSKYIDKIITTSDNNIKIIKQNPSFLRKEIHKIHLSLDTKQFDSVLGKSKPIEVKQRWGIPLIAKVIGRVGRLEPSKCPEDFIKVAGMLKQSSEYPVFFVIGGMVSNHMGELYASRLRELAFEQSLVEKQDYILTGPLTEEEKIALISTFDVYLYPTRWEGYCLSFLEAMYCGKPIVTYDNFANTETVGYAGITSHDSDLVDLQKNTAMLLKFPDIGKILGKEGKAIVVKRNNVKDFAAKIDDLLVVKKSRAPVVYAEPIYSDKKILNICQVGWGLVDNMVSTPEYLQLVHMKKAGHNVSFFCVTQTGNSEVCGVPINRQSKFSPACLKEDPDVVHIHHAENALSFAAATWAKQKGIPVVMNIHSIDPGNNPAKFADVVDKFVVFSDKEVDLRISQGLYSAKFALIPNGIDPTAYENYTEKLFPDTRYNILFVGQFVGFKGVYTLVDVACKFVANNTAVPVMFHMVTHVDKELQELQRYIANTGMGKYITLYTSKHSERKFQQLVNYYHSCDVFFLPTKMDCYPTTILEAMACGKPVVASTVGGIANMIDHEITGFHIPPYDLNPSKYLDRCVKALVLLVDKDKRIAMGEAGRSKVTRMNNITNTVQDYVKLYRSLIK